MTGVPPPAMLVQHRLYQAMSSHQDNSLFVAARPSILRCVTAHALLLHLVGNSA